MMQNETKYSVLVIRFLPIALFCSLAGTALIVANPGLFWDDWVWWFQSAHSNIQIGKELGIWWGGYLSNAIYATSNPVLVLRLIALLSWIFSALAFVYVATHIFRLEGRESVEIFLLIVASHVGLIRFLNSVALYNVYIAFFWIGAALLIKLSRGTRWRWLSLPFFFFSFYLNSLISIYFIMLVMIFAHSNISWEKLTFTWRSRINEWQIKKAIEACLLLLKNDIKTNIFKFAKVYFLFILLPVLFYVVKRILSVHSDFYGGYNRVSFNKAIVAVSKTWEVLPRLLKDYVWSLHNGVPSVWLLAGTIIIFVFALALPHQVHQPKVPKLIQRFLIVIVLAYFSVFPYVVVGKPPKINDFYESRHALVVIPAIIIFLHTVILTICEFISKVVSFSQQIRNVLVSVLIGFSIASSINFSFMLWGDWYRQKAIIDHLEEKANIYKQYDLFIIQDNVPLKIKDRTIWNYEYTGMLVDAIGGRRRMGVSLNEYQSWPPNIDLLHNQKMKERFNMGDFKMDGSTRVALLTTTINKHNFRKKDLVDVAEHFLFSKEMPRPADFVAVDVRPLEINVESRLTEIRRMVDGLFSYRRDFGHFPRSGLSSSVDSQNCDAFRIKSDPSGFHGAPYNLIGDVPGLFPSYLPRPDSMGIQHYPDQYFLYISDGCDFKLVFASVGEIAFAKQTHPSMIDKTRPETAFGFWTDRAIDW